ncbi:hypothetical protein M2480_000783 [Parabacteroides sp. PFB2-12]|nr:hypothetical protein [Parabacteroides sp. PM6-13]MDH6389817.1 hypothetical protein [Parabacteroides sp. PFB2-12]
MDVGLQVGGDLKGEREGEDVKIAGMHAAGVRLCITVCKRSAAYGSESSI